jgi:hypothetical protein
VAGRQGKNLLPFRLKEGVGGGILDGGHEAIDSEGVGGTLALCGFQSSVDLAPLLQPSYVALVGMLLDLP